MGSTNNGAESVDDFLARIAGLTGGRDDAEEQRKKRAEEELIRAKKERQARRAERARSLSPSKTGPLPSLTSSLDPTPPSSKVVNPPVDFSPRSSTLSRSNAVKVSPTLPATNLSTPPSPSFRQSEASETTEKPGPELARSGTLSWQQRPTSKEGSPTRSRPLSGFASIRTKPRDSSPESKPEPSRHDIAAALSSKDPSWFKQTEDRGASSAAYRKNQVEDPPTHSDARAMQLPGMSKQLSQLSRSTTPEIAGQAQDVQSDILKDPQDDRFRRGDTPDMLALRNSMVSPPSVKSTRSDLLGSESLHLGKSDALGTPTKSGTNLSNRPISPTKGLGGFVESAMMRRSDSVSKRWSVQAGAGLKRGDSTASARLTGTTGSIHSRDRSRDASVRGSGPTSSPLGSSRPVSSLDPTQNTIETADPFRTSVGDKPLDLSLRMPASQADTVSQELDRRPATPHEPEIMPETTSKTMDQRRWSPTKSTWLESALQTKSEPVKLQPMKEDTPKWKVDLQRSKSRAGRDDSKKKEPEAPVLTGVDRSSSTSSFKSEKPEVAPKPTLFAVEPRGLAGNESRTLKEPGNSEEKKQEKLSPEKPKQQIPVSSAEATTQPDRAPKLDHVSNSETGKPTSKDMSPTTAKSVRSPPPIKAKPQTPPKTDFRASLKSRTTDRAQENNVEPEFKAMFGKLKRTTTQNYVAPDELKNNILTGKAALNVTDGPQKTEVIDDFKQSIITKKEQMKNSSREPAKIREQNNESQTSVPEALARRKTLSKANGPPPTISSHQKPAVLSTKPGVMTLTPVAKASTSSDVSSATPQRSEEVSPSVSKPVEPTEPKEPSTDISQPLPSSSTKTPSANPPLRDINKSAQLAGKFDAAGSASSGVSMSTKGNDSGGGLPANSKLASRLNPNLAALITRGNSPRPQLAQTPSDDDLSGKTQSVKQEKLKDESTPGSLNHMTKARAKGPKRRAPKTEKTSLPVKTEVRSTASKMEEHDITKPLPGDKPVAGVAATVTSKSQGPTSVSSKQPLRPLAQTKVPPLESSPQMKDTRDVNRHLGSKEAETKAKPIIAAKSPDLRRVSAGRGAPSQSTSQATASPGQKPAVSPPPKPSFSPKVFENRPRPDPRTPPPSDPLLQESVLSAAIEKAPTQQGTSPPITKPSKGLGVIVKPEKPSQKPISAKLEMTPPAESQIAQKLSADSKAVSSILIKYFGSLPKTHERYEFDAQALLKSSSQPSPKYKTKQHTIFELTGDGKKVAMPAGQEHILYEESMYLVTHSFEQDAGPVAAEVYLWCGDRTSEAAIQDVQIFCRKDAREHNAKLTIIKQGKEPQNFFQALGGIVIVRRSKSSALYMLRGRRHLGHVAFDEVDFEASELCPGFAYLISAQFGKLYLWKGKGASPDEVGCARLVGMDLGLTGEIEEVEEGSEPAAFWNSFSSKIRSQWSDDWTDRTKHDGYPCTLLRVEHEQPKAGGFWGLGRATSPDKGRAKAAINKISPLTQQDIEEPFIHVLDAYRSIYVLVNKGCTKRESEFISAVQLAQELAMLSPSIQDRALLPTCYVVFGEPARDIRVGFRKWTPTSKEDSDSLCVRLEEVMEVLDL